MTTGQSPQFKLRVSGGQAFGPATLEVFEQWARQGRVPADALLVPLDGSAVRPVMTEPRLQAIMLGMATRPAATPPTAPTAAVTPPDSGVSVMIPYKNAPALIGYYTSIASLIPLLGALAGPAAVVLGIVGLRKRLKRPEVHGIAHAWIAIILGLIGTLISAGCIVSGIIAAAKR